MSVTASGLLRTPSLCFIAVLSVFLFGCVQYAEFRPGTSSVVAEPTYKLAFIEFGEQGSYREPGQLERALSTIKTTEKPLVITFVHGWQNNAGSSDVDSFKRFLGEIAQSRLITANNYKVVGTYLAWRGAVTKLPVVKYATFFSRKTAAERIASNYDCFDAIASIAQAARGHTEGQYTVLIGHSFGGLIVERAVARAVDLLGRGEVDPAKGTPADMVLLLNPASDSILARQMEQQLNGPTEALQPYIVSLTSQKDFDTGVWFKVATTMGSTTKRFDQVRAGDVTASEREFYTTTPGHEKTLLNHETDKITETIPAPADWTALDYNLAHATDEKMFATEGKQPHTFDLWHFQQTRAIVGPYWIVAVDKEIIPDHTNIWNSRARAMIAALLRTNIPFTKRVQPPEVIGATTRVGPTRSQAPAPMLRRKHDFQKLEYHQTN